MFQGKLICEYSYDAFGACYIKTHEHILNISSSETMDVSTLGYINPYRWKSHYYDTETGLYYIEGRYYSPELGIYLNADNPDRIIENVYKINGLNRHAVALDNTLSNSPNGCNIFTYDKYYPDSSYYPGENISWWQINWQKALKWIAATLLFVTAVILTLIPSTRCIGITMLHLGIKGAISGAIIGGIVGGVVAAIKGGDIFEAINEGVVNGFVDGFITGAVTGLFTGLAGVSGNCFKAGTLVLTAHGYKKIEEIKAGNEVYAYDEKTKKKALKKVVRIFKNKTKKWIHVFVDKEELVCTGEHPFYIINKGWINAEDLIENDKVLLYNGNTDVIRKVEVECLDSEECTYNFEVEDYHTYYVSYISVLVHNKCTLGRKMEKSGNLGAKGEDAHHLLPQKFRPDFDNFDIKIDDVKYGRWMEATKHRKGAYAYNKLWEKAFADKKVNIDNFMELAKQFMQDVYKTKI